MRSLLVPLVLVAAFASVPDVRAQQAVAEPLRLETSGENYLKAIRYRGIDPDVGYFDPSAAVPPLDTAQEPPKPPADQGDGNFAGRVPVIAIAGAVLLGILIVFAMNGRGLTIAFAREVENIDRGRRGRRVGAVAEAVPGALRDILKEPDRRKALILLAQAALLRVVAANGLLVQSSWTARDALRRIPQVQPHLAELTDLVMAGERAHFGGRDVTETEFDGHVARISPLFQEARP